MHLALLTFALTACTEPKVSLDDTGEEADADTDTDTDTDTGAFIDCGEDGICELVVSGVVFEVVEPGTPRTISAMATAANTVEVIDVAFGPGCCPTTVDVTAIASLRTNTIEPSYTVSGDDCDCVAAVSVSYTLSEVPSGYFTLVEGSGSVEVEVP